MISVLYVDDEEVLLEICKQFLERSGDLTVEVSISAKNALDLITSKRFDAIISDYQMPEMDGIELLKEVRSRYSDLPFILFTGKGREEVVIDAINNGADFYLQKGGDPKSQFVELEHKVLQAIRRRQAERLLKDSQSALAESKQMLQSVLDTFPVRVFWKDLNLNYLGCNRQFALDSGLEFPDDLKGKSDYEMGWRDQAELYRADDRAVITSGTPKLNYEEPLTTPNSRKIWVRTSKMPLKDANGIIRGVLGTYEDISGWREAREKIDTLAQFPEQNPNPILRIDVDGILCYKNPASNQLLNHLALEEGKSVPLEWHQRVNDVLNTGKLGSFDQNIGGQTYSITLAPFSDHKFVNFYFVDITQRLRVEQENLKKSEELRAAYEQLKSTNVVLQDNFRMAIDAKRAEEIKKDRAERSIQYQKALVNLAISDAPKLRDAINNITETGSNVLNVEQASIWFFSPDGQSLECKDLYIKNQHIHKSEETIFSQDYPQYFAALHANRTIVADDARTNENTREFTTNYFEPLGITSTLDVPIRSGRHVVGVLCFEHIGFPRIWEVEEQDFAASLADFTVIILEKARRRLAEKDLQKSRDRSRITQFAVDHAAEGIIWIDSDGKMVYSNTTFSTMLDYTSDELFEMTIFAIDSSMTKEKWNLEFAQKKAVGSVTIETNYTKRGGEHFPVEVTSDYFEYGGTGYICSFVRDISERKRAEKALRLANEKLNLLSSVTRHDILNKLSIVLGYLGLSKVTHDREKLEDFIKKIDETIDRKSVV